MSISIEKNAILDNQEEQLKEKVGNLSESEKKQVAENIKIPQKTKEMLNNQRSGIIEQIPEEKVIRIREFVDNYIVSGEFNDMFKFLMIKGGSNDEEFIAGGERQRGMENDLAKIITSLDKKGFDRRKVIQQKNLVIPEKIFEGAGCLDEEVNKISNPKEKSNFLNERLALGRMLRMIDIFDENQIKAMEKTGKLVFKSTFHEGSKRPEDKYSEIVIEMEKGPLLPPDRIPKGGVGFTFLQMSYGISDGQIGLYNNRDYKTTIIHGPFSMLHKIEKGSSNQDGKNVIFDIRNGGKIESFVGNKSIHYKEIIQRFGEGKKVGGTGSTTNEKYASSINDYGKDFDTYKIEKRMTPSQTPTYGAYILLNKIDENHRLNEYFDIKREKITVPGNATNPAIEEKRVIAIVPKYLTGNKVKDHLTSLEIFQRIYMEQQNMTKDEEITQFLQEYSEAKQLYEKRLVAYNTIVKKLQQL